jgi:hypothetical protein
MLLFLLQSLLQPLQTTNNTGVNSGANALQGLAPLHRPVRVNKQSIQSASGVDRFEHALKMPSPLDAVAEALPAAPRSTSAVFSPQASVRLCRAILSLKTLLDAEGERVPLATVTEVYFATHFASSAAYRRLVGFYASIVSYQAIAVCRTFSRFLHLFPGEDLSTDALQVFLDVSAALSTRQGSGGSRSVALAVLYPNVAAATGTTAVSAAQASEGDCGDDPSNIAGVAGAVLREQLRLSGASMPLVEADLCAEVASTMLSGRMPPADVGALLLRLIDGSAARTVRTEGALQFLVVEEAVAAIVDAWAVSEHHAHSALRCVFSLAGASALSPSYLGEDDAAQTAATHSLPCEPGSIMSQLQGIETIRALATIGARDACNVSAESFFSESSCTDPQLLQAILSEVPASSNGSREELAVALDLLGRVWRLAALFVSYDLRRCGLLAPWAFAVIIAASGLYEGASPSEMYRGLEAVICAFAAPPLGPASFGSTPPALSSVFTGHVDRSPGIAGVSVGRYLHEPPVSRAMGTPESPSSLAASVPRPAAAALTAAIRGATPAPHTLSHHYYACERAPSPTGGGVPFLPPASAGLEKESSGKALQVLSDGSSPSAIPWAAAILRAGPEPTSWVASSGVGGRQPSGSDLLNDPLAESSVDYARFWSVLYGLVLQTFAAQSKGVTLATSRLRCDPPSLVAIAERDATLTDADVSSGVIFGAAAAVSRSLVLPRSAGITISLGSSAAEMALASVQQHVPAPVAATTALALRSAQASVAGTGALAVRDPTADRAVLPSARLLSVDVASAASKAVERRLSAPRGDSVGPLLDGDSSDSSSSTVSRDSGELNAAHHHHQRLRPLRPSTSHSLHRGSSLSGWGDEGDAELGVPSSTVATPAQAPADATFAPPLTSPSPSSLFAARALVPRDPPLHGEPSNSSPQVKPAISAADAFHEPLPEKTSTVHQQRHRHRRRLVVLSCATSLGIPSVLPGPQQRDYDRTVELIRRREARAADIANEAADAAAAESSATGAVRFASVLRTLFGGMITENGLTAPEMTVPSAAAAADAGLRRANRSPPPALVESPVTSVVTTSATRLYARTTMLPSASEPDIGVRSSSLSMRSHCEAHGSSSHSSPPWNQPQLTRSAMLPSLEVLPPPIQLYPKSAADHEAQQQRLRASRYKEAISALLAEREAQRRQALVMLASRRAEAEDLARYLAVRMTALRASELERVAQLKLRAAAEVADARTRDLLSRQETTARARRVVLEPSPVALARSYAAAGSELRPPRDRRVTRHPPIPRREPFGASQLQDLARDSLVQTPRLTAAASRNVGVGRGIPEVHARSRSHVPSSAAPTQQQQQQSRSLSPPGSGLVTPPLRPRALRSEGATATRMRRASLPGAALGPGGVPVYKSHFQDVTFRPSRSSDAPARLSYSHGGHGPDASNSSASTQPDAPVAQRGSRQQQAPSVTLPAVSPRVSPREYSFAGLGMNSSRRESTALLDAMLAAAAADYHADSAAPGKILVLEQQGGVGCADGHCTLIHQSTNILKF